MAASNQQYSQVQPPPTGPVSSLSWNKSNFFVATSWDGKIRCWEVMADGQRFNTSPKCELSVQSPILCSAWETNTNASVFFGDCESTAYKWDLQSQTKVQIASHSNNEPIKSILFWESHNVVITGSWDQSVRFWDQRSPNPIHVIQTNFPVHDLDYQKNLLLACGSDKKYMAFNLANTQSSPLFFEEKFLQYQLRSIAVFPDGNGFGVGSIEGRASINLASEFQLPVNANDKKSFAFKCHRQQNRNELEKAYPINSISWHPNGTFFTAGGDGNITFWDKESKQWLGNIVLPNRYSPMLSPISCASYSYDGTVIAAAASYDWFKGEEYASQYPHNEIYLTRTPNFVVPKSK